MPIDLPHIYVDWNKVIHTDIIISSALADILTCLPDIVPQLHILLPISLDALSSHSDSASPTTFLLLVYIQDAKVTIRFCRRLAENVSVLSGRTFFKLTYCSVELANAVCLFIRIIAECG